MIAIRTLCVAAAWLAIVPSVQAADLAGTKAAIERSLDAQYSRIDALYKDIHAHPELGFQETRTAAKLAAELRALGFDVTEGVGRTGIVGLYRNGPGPTVMVRTELDALPLAENTGLPYASKVKQMLRGAETPVMHACGHDIHMAAWVAVARVLLDMKDRWSGTLMFVGQPAEEGGGGAKSMVTDGLFTRFPKPDYGFALHVGPGPFGYVAYKAGRHQLDRGRPRSPSSARAATARNHTPVDPVMMAGTSSSTYGRDQPRERSSKFGVITIGSVRRACRRVIPDSATVRGTIRSYDNDTREDAGGHRRQGGGDDGRHPPRDQAHEGAKAVVNDDPLSARSGAVLKAAFGDKARLMSEPGSASEDYSEFIIAGVPSFYFSIGGLDPKGYLEAMATRKPIPGNHSPEFAPVPEPSIRTGAEAMSLVLLDVLQKK